MPGPLSVGGNDGSTGNVRYDVAADAALLGTAGHWWPQWVAEPGPLANGSADGPVHRRASARPVQPPDDPASSCFARLGCTRLGSPGIFGYSGG